MFNIPNAHCVHWCFGQGDNFNHPHSNSCRTETKKGDKTEWKSQNLLKSVVSMDSGLVPKELNIPWNKGEFAVTWELRAELLNKFFVFSVRVNY